MKKILLLSLLLGLSGCGDNNQSDTSQSNIQAQTLQQAEVTPTVENYSLASSPRAMSAVAPLQGWSITNSKVMGASTLIDAIKDAKVSAALVTPNARQVAEVLRGGAAGIALGIAVDQLLGAVDWVLDPANNQITYKPPATCKNSPSCLPYYQYLIVIGDKYYPDGQQQRACQDWLEAHPSRPLYWKDVTVVAEIPYCRVYGKVYPNGIFNGNIGTTIGRKVNTAYDPTKPDKTLPLEVVAEQVISNADAGSLDAQVATNIAVSNILNDAEQAEPVVDELERNAKRKCAKHEIWMDDQAARVRDRYADMYRDRYNQYENHYEESNPLILDGVNKGSWIGHVTQYRIQQVKLQGFIIRAINDNCPPTTFATYWVSKDHPPKPGVDSPN